MCIQGVLGDDLPSINEPGISTKAAAEALPFGPARLVLLLNNPPTTGKGAVGAVPLPPSAPAAAPGAYGHVSQPGATPPAAPAAPAAVDIPEDARQFYDELAGLAAVLGVTVDTFAVGPRPLALAAVAPLCQRTGGACFHYPSQEQAAIPQDLCRRLQTPQV